ncbi:hypothetical protein [Dermabacter hominis]|nr:hypothetical protein [Dermabacter sp.]
MSSNQWNQAPTNHGAVQGQPAMGYLGAMPQQKKSNTGLWVGFGCGCLLLLALLIGVIVLAVMLMGGDDSKESKDGGTTTSAAAPAPNPAPAPNGGDSTAPNPAPAPNDGGNDPGPAPMPEQPSGDSSSNKPQQVGDYTLAGVGTGNTVGADYVAAYSNSAMDYIEVYGAANPTLSPEDEKKTITDGQEINGWTCGTFQEDPSQNICVKSSNGTDVVKVIGTPDTQTLANFGDQFIAAGGASS